MAGPTSAGTTATGAASQLAVNSRALQPATASSKAPNAKILRRSPPLWTFPRLDGSAVPMSHLTPMVGSTVWPGGHARGNSYARVYPPTWRKLAGVGRTSGFIPTWASPLFRHKTRRSPVMWRLALFSTVSQPGNIAMPRITGNMNRPSGPTIFTGSWLAAPQLAEPAVAHIIAEVSRS